MIDLVGEVARFEQRWAPEVVTDILKHPAWRAEAGAPAVAPGHRR